MGAFLPPPPPSSLVFHLPRLTKCQAVQMTNASVKMQARDNSICQAISDKVPLLETR